MKCVALVCLLFTLTAADYVVKTQENLLEYREACAKELSVSADLLEKYKKWEYPNDSITQCYMKCVFVKFGLFDTQSGFNVEYIHEQLAGGKQVDHHEELHGKIAACIDKNTQGSNACEWAYRGATCLLKNHLPLVQQSLAPKAGAVPKSK